jgi:rfaE bifunctional protein kinase chain/domain
MNNDSVVFVSGNFNILHPGHFRLLRFAKECGMKLIVGVYSDKHPNANAILPEKLRLDALQSNNLVDECFLIEDPVIDVIKRIKPNIVVKGKEYELQINEELEALSTYGGRLVFSSGDVFSSSELINNELKGIEESIKFTSQLNQYLFRHGLSSDELKRILDSMNNLRILVLGDLIIDEYITCDPLGMSQEDPTIVVTPVDHRLYIGGAGIVAGHAAGLGGTVDFITVTGDDLTSEFAKKSLEEMKVRTHFFIDVNRPTTLKQRFRCKGKTLLRVSRLCQGSINSTLQSFIYEKVMQLIDSIDLVIFSDFNYGCIPDDLLNKLVELCNKKNKLAVADSQCSSQVGDISRFKNMYLLTPTEHEARISVRDNESGLVILAEKLRNKANAKNLLLKIGEEGVLVHAEAEKNNRWVTDRIPALNKFPKDVAGAGDSMLITVAMSLASGAKIWESAALGSIAAAVQVGRVGNIPLSVSELKKHI